VAVYRTERTVWRLELTPPMVTLVESLLRGETLGVSLSLVAAHLEGEPEAEAARSVTTWFSHAVSSGLFSGIRT
jgi:lipid-binding SYLF domain-containing protein